MDGTTDLGMTSLTASPGKAMLFNGTEQLCRPRRPRGLGPGLHDYLAVFRVLLDGEHEDQRPASHRGQSTGFLTDDSPGWTVCTDDGYLYFQLDAGGTFGISVLQASDLNAAVCNVTNSGTTSW